MPNNEPTIKKAPYYTLTIPQQLNLILYEAAKNNQLPEESGNSFSEVLLNAISTFQNDKTADNSMAVWTLAMGAEDENNTGAYALLRSLIYTQDKKRGPEGPP